VCLFGLLSEDYHIRTNEFILTELEARVRH